MSDWKLVDVHPTRGRVFRRLLDASELSFFWDGLFNGTADSLQHFELRLLDSSRDTRLFSVANILRAWVSTKRRYPLVGATVQGVGIPHLPKVATISKAARNSDNSTGVASEPCFAVREHDLSLLRPREIVFGQVTNAEEAQQRAVAIMDGPRPLSEELLVQLYVFRETDSGRKDVLHLMSLMAHSVTDGVANNTFMRCLLDTLARGGDPESEPAQIPLEDRLALASPPTELEPVHLRSLGPARRRWRRAIGAVIFKLRMEKRQGGHTLPCRLMRSTPHVPARSCRIATSLTQTQSAAVIANCHLHDITFGNAYLTLAQVAMTRVLYRRYLRGEISEEEWAYRKRQPYISGGPVNLRPYLDKAWFDRGGGGEFMQSIGFSFYELPFMTLGTSTERLQDCHDSNRVLSDGAPPLSDLLTFDRFLHRVGLVKKQATMLFGHPLFNEIVRAAHLLRVEPLRLRALQWMKHVETVNGNDAHGDPDKDEVLAVADIPSIWAHGGSSVGNLDLICPSEYPLPPTHPLSPYSPVSHPAKAGYVTPPSPSPSPSSSSSASGADTTPKITVEHISVHLHTRPSELYLGASSLRGQMNMFVFYDGNVFEEAVVREWLDEVREAALWYLGSTRPSGRSQQSRCAGNGRAGLDKGVRAKL